MANLIAFLLPLLLSSAEVSTSARKLSLEINPGCGDTCKNKIGSLFHVTADGPNDTLHHIWDFYQKPTVFFALTRPNSSFTIDWDNFFSDKGHSWKFSHKHNYAFAYVIDNVIEYDDVNDTAYFTPLAEKRVLPADDFEWTSNTLVVKSDEVVVRLTGEYPKDNKTSRTGQIIITLTARGKEGYTNSTPHLYQTVNSSTVDVVFNGMPTSFNHSRYALEIGIFSTNDDPTITQKKTEILDDEHTPGVFTVAEVFTALNESLKGFMQWKTIAYKTNDRLMTQSTNVNDSRSVVIGEPSKSYANSGVFAYFGKHVDKIAAHSIVVSFGDPDDNFYNDTRYLAWTLLAGVGQPVEDHFSLMVIAILFIGVLVALFLLVVSVGCIISRRVAGTRDQLLS